MFLRWFLTVRALPRMWRTVPCDASTAYAAALQQGTGAALGAAITRRALRPGNVACGDSDCGAPYHRVITLAPTIFLAKPLARLAARPLWRPVTTGLPHRATCRGRRLRPLPAAGSVVTGRCASDRPPDERHHGADRRLVGAGRLHAGSAGVRRPQGAPATLDGRRPHQRRAAGTVYPDRHMHPWVAGSSRSTYAKRTAAGTTPSPPAPGPPRCDAWPQCRPTSSARPSHQ